MRRFIGALALGAVATLGYVGQADALFVQFATGSIQTNDDTMVATNPPWVPSSLSYTVSFDAGSSQWKYEYTFATPSGGKDISHFLIEVSPGFTFDDDVIGTTGNATQIEVGNNTSANGNPGIPGDLYSIKFSDFDPDAKTETVSLTTLRGPEWGDFYAKDGTVEAGSVDVIAYNAGFLTADPGITIDFGTPSIGCVTNGDGTDCTNHILRPDTMTVVPIPGAVWLFGTALAGLGLFARRKIAA